jgi:DNA-binding transcriptional regulator YhcF (GntR family)
MKWDKQKIEQGKKDVAKTQLKAAIKTACEAGLYYDDICNVVAKVLNEIANETKKTTGIK